MEKHQQTVGQKSNAEDLVPEISRQETKTDLLKHLFIEICIRICEYIDPKFIKRKGHNF